MIESVLHPEFHKPHEAKILLALGLNNLAIILATDSEWVEEEACSLGNSTDDIGILISPTFNAPALILWEGVLTVRNYNQEDGGETEYDGECRSVHGLELAQLLDMVPASHPGIDDTFEEKQ